MLYIIRHGKTDWNAGYKLQGRTDISLNDEGREMARRARNECDEIDFDVCYSSPLIRARETAEILLEGRDIPIITDDRLIEMCFGEYEGVENALTLKDSPIAKLFNKPEKYVTVKDGESVEELYKRTKSFIDEVAIPLHEQGKKVLVVGHGAMNCSLINQIKNIPIERFWEEMTDNCKLVKIM